MRVLMVDNYDSFTYNLVQYLGELGAELEVVRNDRGDVGELVGRGFDRVVVSPGPCTPDQAGISLEAVRRFPEAGVDAIRFIGPDVPSWKWGPRTIPGRGPRDTYG